MPSSHRVLMSGSVCVPAWAMSAFTVVPMIRMVPPFKLRPFRNDSNGRLVVVVAGHEALEDEHRIRAGGGVVVGVFVELMLVDEIHLHLRGSGHLDRRIERDAHLDRVAEVIDVVRRDVRERHARDSRRLRRRVRRRRRGRPVVRVGPGGDDLYVIGGTVGQARDRVSRRRTRRDRRLPAVRGRIGEGLRARFPLHLVTIGVGHGVPVDLQPAGARRYIDPRHLTRRRDRRTRCRRRGRSRRRRWSSVAITCTS